MRLTWCGALAVMLLGLPGARAGRDPDRRGAPGHGEGIEDRRRLQAGHRARGEGGQRRGRHPGRRQEDEDQPLAARRHVGRREERAAGRAADHPEQVARHHRRLRLASRCRRRRWCPTATASRYLSGGAGATAIFGRSKWVFGTLSPVEHLAETQMKFLDDLVKQGKLKTPLTIALVTREHRARQRLRQGRERLRQERTPGTRSSSTRSSSSTPPTTARCSQRVAEAKTRSLHGRLAPRGLHRHAPDVHADGPHHQMRHHGARGSDEAARKALGPATDYIFASGWWSDLLPYPQVKAFSARSARRRPASSRSGTTPWRYETVRALCRAISKAVRSSRRRSVPRSPG